MSMTARVLCSHCQRPTISGPGTFCCQTAELNALRLLSDELAQHIDSEITPFASMGALESTAYAMMRQARQRIKAVRGR